jgi:hypothetical protein
MVAPLTQAEGQRLADAIGEHFGACTCRSWHIISGARVWVETCAGHRFLAEPNRIDLLRGIARDVARLQREERLEKALPLPPLTLPW